MVDFNLYIKSAIAALVILTGPVCTFGQVRAGPKLSLEFGYSLRSTGFQELGEHPNIPISWQKNLTGSRGKFGVGYRVTPKIELRYAAGIHYDHSRVGAPGSGVIEYKDWFLDHNFGVRYYPRETNLLSRYFIFEVSRINSNSSLEIFWNGEWQTYDLAFTAVGVGAGFRVWRFILEPRISLSDFGNAFNRSKRFTFISIDLLYRLGLIHNKK